MKQVLVILGQLNDKARYTIDWQSKRVQGFGGDYEVKFSDAELRIQRKTEHSSGEWLNKASESIIMNRSTGEYFLSERSKGKPSRALAGTDRLTVLLKHAASCLEAETRKAGLIIP